jgi:hypothetical protein
VQAAAIVFAVVAAALMATVVWRMAWGEDDDPGGWILRAACLCCFVVAGVLNSLRS